MTEGSSPRAASISRIEARAERRLRHAAHALVDERVQRMQARMIVIAQAARPRRKECSVSRAAGRPIGDELVDLLLVLHDGEADVGVFEHVGHFVGDGVRIDRHRNGAQHLRGA